jgi:hypothetical protein
LSCLLRNMACNGATNETVETVLGFHVRDHPAKAGC